MIDIVYRLHQSGTLGAVLDGVEEIALDVFVGLDVAHDDAGTLVLYPLAPDALQGTDGGLGYFQRVTCRH